MGDRAENERPTDKSKIKAFYFFLNCALRNTRLMLCLRSAGQKFILKRANEITRSEEIFIVMFAVIPLFFLKTVQGNSSENASIIGAARK